MHIKEEIIMKKQVLALVFCVTLALVGCGNASATDNVAAEAPKEEVAVAESATKEEPKAEETAKAEEKVEQKVEEKTEEKTEEVVSEVKEDEKASQEASTESATTQEVVIEDNQAQAAAPAQTEVKTEQAATSTIIEKYIADGDFSDFQDYGAEIGAGATKISKSEWNIDYYFDSYIISVGTNQQDPEYSYIAVGTMNGDMQYACLISYKDVPTVPVSANGTFVPVETLMKLEQTINYMKSHTDVTQKPDIPGMTWQSWADLVG